MNNKILSICLLSFALPGMAMAAEVNKYNIKIAGGVTSSLAKNGTEEAETAIFSDMKSKANNFEMGLSHQLTKKFSLGITYGQMNYKLFKKSYKVIPLEEYSSTSQNAEAAFNEVKNLDSSLITPGESQYIYGFANTIKDDGAQELENTNKQIDFLNALHRNAKAKLRSQALMLEANYEFGEHPRLVPYVAAGVGGVFHQLGDFNYADGLGNTASIDGKQKLNMAYSVGVGLKMPINDNIALDLSGSYYDHGKIKSNTELTTTLNGETDNEQIEPLKMRLHGFKFMAGVRFSF
jgi:opacity protein-like surface antigen